VEYDRFYLWNHIFRCSQTRSRCSTSPDPEPDSSPARNNVGFSRHGRCDRSSEYSDLRYRVQSTTGTLEDIDGIDWEG
jgi:hypothetical protein